MRSWYVDKELYSCIAGCDEKEVVITDERIRHIQERHPGAYDTIEPFIEEALKEPDYILEDRHPNTGLILKAEEENGIRFQIVLRIHTAADAPAYRNSIISAWTISEKRWKRYLSNRNVLYRRE